MFNWRFFLALWLTIGLVHQAQSDCPAGCDCTFEKNVAICRNLSSSDLPSFDKDIHELDIGTNRIKTIKPEALKEAINLKRLSLDYNSIKELPDNLLSSTKLEVFSASHNSLSKVKFLEGQNALKRIDLSYNKLEELPKEIFSNFKELIMLDLEGNKLKNPLPALQGLPILSKLTLDGNPIEEINGKDLESIPKLKFLYAVDCGITKVDFTSSLPIFTLNLSGNNLKKLKANTFSGLEYCFEINLEDTGLKSLPLNGFVGLNWLRRLSLANNPILALSKENFQNLPKLEALNLGHVNLKSLDPDLFNELPKLGNLTLADNKLTSIKEGALSGVKKLYTLDLSNNQLTSFSHKVLASNNKLSRLILSGNPLKCNCEMFETAKWAQNRELSSEGECSLPDSLAGKQWIDSVINLNCLSESKIEELA